MSSTIVIYLKKAQKDFIKAEAKNNGLSDSSYIKMKIFSNKLNYPTIQDATTKQKIQD